MTKESKYNIADEISYNNGQIIFKEGSPGKWIFVILSGSVEISKQFQEQKTIIEILKPGEIFGELGFIGRIKRTATAKAVGMTTLGIIDQNFLEKEYNKLSWQLRSIIEILSLRFEAILYKLNETGNRTIPKKQVVLTLSYKDRDTFLRSYIANIDNGGLFIKSEKPLAKNFEFLLKLQLPGISDPLQIKSKVILQRNPEDCKSNHPPGMGIEFKNMSIQDRKFLDDFVMHGSNP